MLNKIKKWWIFAGIATIEAIVIIALAFNVQKIGTQAKQTNSQDLTLEDLIFQKRSNPRYLDKYIKFFNEKNYWLSKYTLKTTQTVGKISDEELPNLFIKPGWITQEEREKYLQNQEKFNNFIKNTDFKLNLIANYEDYSKLNDILKNVFQDYIKNYFTDEWTGSINSQTNLFNGHRFYLIVKKLGVENNEIQERSLGKWYYDRIDQSKLLFINTKNKDYFDLNGVQISIMAVSNFAYPVDRLDVYVV